MRKSRIPPATERPNRYSFPVSDVPILSTAQGTSKENDEMRKLVTGLESAFGDIDARLGDVAAGIPGQIKDALTGPDSPIKPVKFPVLEVWQDGNAIVIGTRIWDFVETDDIRFRVTDLGGQHAKIEAFTKKHPQVAGMWGKGTGGYGVEIPNSGATVLDPAIYGAGAVTYSSPFTPYRDRTLFHFVGDYGLIEPELNYTLSGTNLRLGYLRDVPALETAVWGAKTQSVTILGQKYDIFTAKTRVAPSLQIFDPDESVHTTSSVTRVFAKDSDTATLHVDVDDPVASGLYWNGTDPRTFTAKLWVDVKDDAFDGDNLGSAGAGIAEVFKERIGRVLWHRRIKQGSGISVTQDGDYITIAATGSGGADYYFYNEGGYAEILDEATSTATDQYFRTLSGTGMATVTQHSDWIEINVPEVSDGLYYAIANDGAGEQVYIADSGTGTIGDPYTFHLRNILAGDNTDLSSTTSTDIVIDSWKTVVEADGLCVALSTPYNFLESYSEDSGTHIATAKLRNFAVANDLFLDVCSGGAYVFNVDVIGENLLTGFEVYYDKTHVSEQTRLQMRTLYEGTGITMTYMGTDNKGIMISCDVVDTNDTYEMDNVGGAAEVWRDTDDSGAPNHIFNLRTLSGTGDMWVTQGADTIDIYHTVVGYNLHADDTYYKGLYDSKDWLDGDTTLNFKVLKAGTGITLSDLGDAIEITAVGGDSTLYYDVVNTLGTDYKLVNASTGTGVSGDPITFPIKTLVADGAITLSYVSTNSIKIFAPAYTFENEGGKVEIYDETTSTSTNSVFRTLSGTGATTVTQHSDWVEINTPVVTDTNTLYDHLAVTATGGAKLRLHGSDGSTDDVLFRGAGGTTVSYIDPDTIEISSTDNDHLYAIDNCAAGTGTGFVYHDSTVAGSLETFHLRTIKQSTGITVTTSGHDIIIACTIVDTNTLYDHLVVTAVSGAKLRLHGTDSTNDDVLFTSAGNTVLITRTDDDTMNFEVNLDEMPYNVIGDNINDCGIASAPYGWYYDYSDNALTHTRTLLFRGFAVSNDLILTECNNDYLLDVNVTGFNQTSSNELYIGKTASQLKFRGLVAGTGVTITQEYDTVNPGDDDLVISATGTTYSISAVDISGVANLRLTGSDATTDDVAFVGTGSVTVTRTDADTITIDGADTTYTYHLLDGSPAPGTGTSDKVILRLHESTGTNYDITFREGVGVSFSRTSDQLSITGNLSSISALDGTPAPGSGTTDQVVIRLTNTNDASTSDITLNEGSGIVLTRSGNNITIASAAGNTSDVDNCAAGGGAQVFHDTTVAGSNTTYHLRTINATDGYVTVTQNTHEIVISATNPLHWYAYGDQGGGTHSLRGTITGAGTYASPYAFNFKTVNAGNGILIDDATNLLTIKTDFTVTAMGLDQPEVSTLEFVDNQFGIVAIHDTATANKSKVTLVNYNYSTRWDTAYFCNAGAKTTDKTIASGSWEKLYFDNSVIQDEAGWVFADETETVDPPWYFMHDETEDCVFEVKLKLFILGRYPTSNTIAASMYYPKIGVFVNDVHYDVLDVNTDLHLEAQLRQSLLATAVISSSDVTEAGTKAYLEGSLIVKGVSATDKIDVRFAHETGNDRYFKIKEGAISITKIAVKGAFDNPVEAAINYNQT